MQGTVIKSTGSQYFVLAEGNTWLCKLKGKVRLEGRKSTNPIAVGDIVEIEKESDNEGSIVTIHPRKNYIIRKSINLSKQVQIIASNIDQAVLFATLAAPRTSLGFIDRFLITAEAYSIPALIIFNKKDILDEESLQVQEEVMNIYRGAGYDCYSISAYDKKDVEKLKEIFRNKTTLVSGHSGTGKSTFINAMQPGLDLKTSEISSVHLKGTHTTTFAEMFPLDLGGSIIDTPGIKELGLVEMKKEEVGHYFPEIRSRMNDCKFNNCTHVNEPACAVREAAEKGEISPERYESYLRILSGEEMDWNEWETK